MIGTLIHAKFEQAMSGAGSAWTDDDLVELEALGANPSWAEKLLDKAVRQADTLLTKYRITDLALELRVNPGAMVCRDDFWGTADLVGANPRAGTLLVADLKTGRIPVGAEWNDQLLSYALGAAGVIDKPLSSVTVAIIQPTAHKQPPVWEFSPGLLCRFATYARKRAALTDDPATQPEPSPSACKWCDARPVCPSHQNNIT